MPKTLSAERLALLDSLVEQGWPLIEMKRTHRFDWHTVRKYHPEYRGISDKTEQGQLGNAARQLTLALRKNYAHPSRTSHAKIENP
jgi:hypothetical protein